MNKRTLWRLALHPLLQATLHLLLVVLAAWQALLAYNNGIVGQWAIFALGVFASVVVAFDAHLVMSYVRARGRR